MTITCCVLSCRSCGTRMCPDMFQPSGKVSVFWRYVFVCSPCSQSCLPSVQFCNNRVVDFLRDLMTWVRLMSVLVEGGEWEKVSPTKRTLKNTFYSLVPTSFLSLAVRKCGENLVSFLMWAWRNWKMVKICRTAVFCVLFKRLRAQRLVCTTVASR